MGVIRHGLLSVGWNWDAFCVKKVTTPCHIAPSCATWGTMPPSENAEKKKSTGSADRELGKNFKTRKRRGGAGF